MIDSTLQIRLPEELKQQFLEKLQEEGRSMSNLLRLFIEAYVDDEVDLIEDDE